MFGPSLLSVVSIKHILDDGETISGCYSTVCKEQVVRQCRISSPGYVLVSRFKRSALMKFDKVQFVPF